MSITLVAHRGYPTRYPENTMIGFQAAVDAGARWLETDIQLSRDGQPMLYHDGTLDRISLQEGSVWDYDADQLTQISAGYAERFDARYSEVKIATLDELVTWAEPQQELRLLIELKHESIAQSGVARMVESVSGVITEELRPRCTIISKHLGSLQHARRLGFDIGWILSAWSETIRREADELKPELMICKLKRLPIDQRPWPGPWRWMIYPIDDVATAHTMIERGISILETNAIGEIIKVADWRGDGA